MKREPMSAAERSGTQKLRQQRHESCDISACWPARDAPHLVDTAFVQEHRGVVGVPVEGAQNTKSVMILLGIGALTRPRESGCYRRSRWAARYHLAMGGDQQRRR